MTYGYDLSDNIEGRPRGQSASGDKMTWGPVAGFFLFFFKKQKPAGYRISYKGGPKKIVPL